jgi:hypothetical protein
VKEEENRRGEGKRTLGRNGESGGGKLPMLVLFLSCWYLL